jgi:hypothetical protein
MSRFSGLKEALRGELREFVSLFEGTYSMCTNDAILSSSALLVLLVEVPDII